MTQEGSEEDIGYGWAQLFAKKQVRGVVCMLIAQLMLGTEIENDYLPVCNVVRRGPHTPQAMRTVDRGALRLGSRHGFKGC